MTIPLLSSMLSTFKTSEALSSTSIENHPLSHHNLIFLGRRIEGGRRLNQLPLPTTLRAILFSLKEVEKEEKRVLR
jgi:hypothetical protein